jgi:hypothetical protein
VRVDPERAVVLHDTLSRIVRDGPFTRVRIAELSPGERVHVAGTLSGASAGGGGGDPRQNAYRDAPPVPLLRGPSIGPMVISTEQPGDTEAKRARFHGIWASLLVPLFALSLLALSGFDLLALAGRTVIATPSATLQWQEWVKPKNGTGHWEPRYAVRAIAEVEGVSYVFEDTSSSFAYQCAREGTCELPFRFTPIPSASNVTARIGSGPTLAAAELMVAMPVGMVVFVYLMTTLATRPWYMRRRIVDYGSGRLGEA